MIYILLTSLTWFVLLAFVLKQFGYEYDSMWASYEENSQKATNREEKLKKELTEAQSQLGVAKRKVEDLDNGRDTLIRSILDNISFESFQRIDAKMQSELRKSSDLG